METLEIGFNCCNFTLVGTGGTHSRQAKPIYIEIKLKIFRLELFLPHSFWEQGLISYFSA